MSGIIPVFKSKLRAPIPNREMVMRTRLLAQMSEFSGTLRLLSGGAGFGKTELARQYGEAFDGRVLWYTLDDADSDEAVFAAHLNCFAATGLRGYEPDGALAFVPHDICRALEAELCNGTRYLLIFDGAEHLMNSAAALRLCQLITNVPEGTQILITSRAQPPDALARFVVEGAALSIGGRELLFENNERNRLAELVLPAVATDTREHLLNEFFELFGGWPAAESLAFSYIRELAIPYEEVDWRGFLRDSMLEQYIRCEVFSSFEEPERSFMIKTAALPMVNTHAIAAVFGDLANATVSKLIIANTLFGAGEDYHYIGIYKQFLQGMGDNAERKSIGRAMAEFWLGCGDFVRAAENAAAAEDGATAALILERFGVKMLFDDCDALRLCVECASSAGFASATPEALGIAAQFYYKTGDDTEAERLLTRADSSFGKENKYGIYRGLYRGLLRYSQDTDKYEKIINNAVFYLTENGFALPYLKLSERELLDTLSRGQIQRTRRLTVRFFGEFSAHVLGESKPLSWRTRKSVELFAYLTERGGAAVGRRQVLGRLWEDEMPDNAVAMLHNMIYNIRKELAAYGLTDVICYKDKMYSINMDEVDTDLDEVRAAVTTATATANGAAGFDELFAVRDLFRVYRGRYLEDIDSPWVTELREHYDAGFVRGCEILADHAMKNGDYEAAVVFLKNVLAINPYSEEHEGALLEGFGHLGSLRQAKTEYERFCQLLMRDLGIEPTEALGEIYRRVMSRA